MAQSFNPFDVLELRLNSIEDLLLELKQKLIPQSPAQSDQWFDINELCNYLPDKPKKSTVYFWIHTGMVPVHKGGKKLRFLKSEIDSWLMQGKQKTLAESSSEADAYLLRRKNKNRYGKAPPNDAENVAIR